MVRAVGLEPTRACAQRIFITLRLSPPVQNTVRALGDAFTSREISTQVGAVSSLHLPFRAWHGVDLERLLSRLSPFLTPSTPRVSSEALKFLKSAASTIPPRSLVEAGVGIEPASTALQAAA